MLISSDYFFERTNKADCFIFLIDTNGIASTVPILKKTINIHLNQ